MSLIWTETFRVHAYETDPHGGASLQTLCNYFQEAAGLHARALGVAIDDLLAYGLTWVLARLRIEIDRYPAWGDEVSIETWPSGRNGLYTTRDFRILADGGNDGRTELGRGTSAWLVLDIARKRPVRIPPQIEAIAIPERARALAGGFERFPPIPEAPHPRRFHVRYSDLDINQHVNNVRYAEWAVESVPEDILHTRCPRALELHFRAETMMGDLVVVHAHPDGDDAFHHRLVHAHAGHDVALAHTRWRDR